MKVAVLLTCHNRRRTTLRCLDSLHVQGSREAVSTEVWLVDAGSTDGTRTAVTSLYPAVRTIGASAELYWCGGMRSAWSHAAQHSPDAFLWLNDDVVLAPDALAALGHLARAHPDAILVGSCRSPQDGRRSYGGLRRTGAHPGKLVPVEPTDDPQPCDTFEGNIVWIPAAAYRAVGSLRPFTHSMGDVDYGYRAAAAGIPLLVAPGFLGTCARNPVEGTWQDRRLPLRRRLQLLYNPKGLPLADWWNFCRAHGGCKAPWYFISPLLRVVLGQ